MSTLALERASDALVTDVEYDDLTAEAVRPFDLDPTEQLGFFPWKLPALPDDFTIGLIVGASGSGKSVLLREFGGEQPVTWQRSHSIISHFESPEDGSERLYAVGLNAVPVWRKPYHVLSNGQQFRSDLARRIGDGAVVDEFTSVVDRNVAVAASRAIRAWANRKGVRKMVFASCHRDVVPWLEPDWVIDTDAGEVTIGATTHRPPWWAQHVTSLAGAVGMSEEVPDIEQLSFGW